MKPLLLVSLQFIFFCEAAIAQSGERLYDGRKTPYCSTCIRLINEMPKEVLFGIQITSTGEVLFSTNNKVFFEELLQSPTDGITVDLVSKDLYECNKQVVSPNELTKGYVLPVVYLTELKKRMKELGGGQIAIEIGKLPPELKDKEVEGNLTIIKSGVVCYYTYFVDIPRSVWDFLPMGLYADSLVSTASLTDKTSRLTVSYTKKLQFTIPFPKYKAAYAATDFKPLYDSLRLGAYRIKKIDIRAYSSVEGEEIINAWLQQKRAAAINAELQKKQGTALQPVITTAENWVDFFNDIKHSSHPELATLPQSEIRLRLLDKTISNDLEPIFKKHRKAVITLYVDTKSEWSDKKEPELLLQFRTALEKKELYKASLIQSEVFERVSSNQLPSDFLDRLEVPMEKDFISLLTQKETYKYQLSLTDEREAIEHFKLLLSLEPENGKVLYNICSLSFEPWKYDSSFVSPHDFYHDINSLESKGIASSLIKRMLINFHVRMCEIHMARYQYAQKDSSLAFIRKQYETMLTNDQELVSMAKYLSYYSHREWAIQLLSRRAVEPDASEDLIFYYINLCLFDPMAGYDDLFKKVANNAISINKERYCRIFNSVNAGGASFQLLGNEKLKLIYCQSCNR